MKKWFFSISALVRGKPALGLSLASGFAALYYVLAPLPWEHFPSLWKMLMASWIYAGLMTGVIYSAVASASAGRGISQIMSGSLAIGLLWKYTPLLGFLPLNFSRILIVYGLAGLCVLFLRQGAAAVRRDAGTAPARTMQT
jgi:hypothetical protein